MLEIDGLRKSFRGRVALEGLSLSVSRGEIFGLLGHNGAGKSTTFGLILGHLHADAGDARIRGLSVRTDRLRALRGVGAIFETPSFYDYLSGWTNLRILAAYSGKVDLSELERAVGLVGLRERIHDPVRVYSHGMRQRLALAQALVPAPDLILLDEPTEGLDPEGIHEIRNLILRLNSDFGLTVLLSSHLLSEVEALCGRIAILNRGKLMFQGPWSDLARDGDRFRIEVSDNALAARAIAELGMTLAPEQDGAQILHAGAGDIADAVAAMVTAGVRVRAVEPVRRSLEQIYLETVAGQGT